MVWSELVVFANKDHLVGVTSFLSVGLTVEKIVFGVKDNNIFYLEYNFTIGQ